MYNINILCIYLSFSLTIIVRSILFPFKFLFANYNYYLVFDDKICLKQTRLLYCYIMID